MDITASVRSAKGSSASNPICVDDYLSDIVTEAESASSSHPICVDDFLSDTESETKTELASSSHPICVDDYLSETESETKIELVDLQECNNSSSLPRDDYSYYSEVTYAETVSERTEVTVTEKESEVHDAEQILNDRNDLPDSGDNEKDKNGSDDCRSNDSVVSEAENGESTHTRKRRNVSFAGAGSEEQEWTYEEHILRSMDEESRRENRRKQRCERAKRQRMSTLMWFAVALLLLEVAAATIAIMNHKELIECCGRSIFSEDESTAERWNTILYYIGVCYLLIIILVEFPTLIIAQEPLFVFNPMVGYLLVMQMMYATDPRNAYIIFGLEVCAMIGQSTVLGAMHRTPELCIHSILNYTLAGITIYLLLRLTGQGGYCIVNDRIQSIFSEMTCNVSCTDGESCFQCLEDGNEDISISTQCFIHF